MHVISTGMIGRAETTHNNRLLSPPSGLGRPLRRFAATSPPQSRALCAKENLAVAEKLFIALMGAILALAIKEVVDRRKLVELRHWWQST